MHQGVYAVIGIIAAAVIAAVVLSLDQDQGEIPTPEINIQTPMVETQPGESSDDWNEQPVTFKDSNGYIPDIMVSQRWTNGDALHACSIMVDDPSIRQTIDESDINWCREFLEAYRNR